MARPTRFKQTIFETATRLFSEHGLSATGIREIAREAGVSEAAMYRHWKGKQELAQAIFLQGMANLHERLQQEVPTTGPTCAAVLATVRIFFEAYDSHREVTNYILLNQHEVWRHIDREQPNPVGFWFDLLRSRSHEFDMCEELSGEIIGPITLGMILRPGIAAAYNSIPVPLAQHAQAVAMAICRVLGVAWQPNSAV
jgi:AcrR family transcriptional regulator